MASSKTLIRTGVSLMTRFLNRTPHANPNPIISQTPELIALPKLLPSLLIPQFDKATLVQFPQHQSEVELQRKLSSQGFLYPTGLPSLPFFLPEGNFQFFVFDSCFLLFWDFEFIARLLSSCIVVLVLIVVVFVVIVY
ncbi:UNVERIFIED_CONTAM: hypothetical protein Sindi_1212500 [Sesamum indicum]